MNYERSQVLDKRQAID